MTVAKDARLANTVADVDRLDELLSEPSPRAIDAMTRLDGALVLLGAREKLGPMLASMARRASDVLLSNGKLGYDLSGRLRFDTKHMIARIADWTRGGGTSLVKPTHFEIRDGTN